MSLLDKASLIVTPNSYKESKLYSVVPNTTLGDMDVVRATTATRVNSAGLIEVVPRNIFTYSEQFDNAAWTKTNVTVSANATNSPTGILTADKLVENSANDIHFINGSSITFSAGSYSISIFAKASERSVLQIFLNGSANVNAYANFNLTSGVVSAFNDCTATIQSIDNGWYRCVLTATVLSSTVPSAYFCIQNSTTATRAASYLGNGTSGLFIWGAQLEAFPTATEYFPTTTRLNIPRIDYTNGSCPSLLVEPQRTNVLTYSEQFDNAAWVKSSVGSGLNPVVTSNISTSPSGNNDADRIVFNTTLSTDISQIVQTIPLTVSSTGSVYLKAFASGDVGKIIAIRFNSAGYTLVTLTNSWQRFSVTATALGSFDIALRPVIGTSTGSVSVLAWGAQLEAGSYATSYIPTLGASSVTRNADVISKTGISSLIGQTEGTVFCEIKLETATVGNSVYAILNNGTFSNSILIGKEAGVTPNKLVFYISANGTVILNNTSTALTSNFVKCAIAYKSGDWVAYLNGSIVASGTTTFSFGATLDRFGYSGNANLLILNEKIDVKSTQLYKTRLSNSELAQLTTL